MTTLPLIDIVKRQALLTFSKRKTNSTSFDDNLAKLKNQVSRLTCADVKLDRNLLDGQSGEWIRDIKKSGYSSSSTAPVTYIEIYDDSDITIGIFVLRSGARLPLHDHPLMYGVLKVIYGSVHIQSYSVVTSDEISSQEQKAITPCDIALSRDTLNRQIALLARKEPEVIISEKDSACILSPTKSNIHEIRTVSGPAAFIDILSPPYESEIPGVGPRPCRYFKEVGCFGGIEDVKQLLRISNPSDYWSESAPYKGPPLS